MIYLLFSVMLIVRFEVDGLDINFGKFLQLRKPVVAAPPSELDQILDVPELKPWRSPKTRYLKYEYRPWKDSWKERLRTGGDEDTVYLYGIPSVRNIWDRTRPEDLWLWPWLCKHVIDSISTVPIYCIYMCVM
jgi:hypothetical protein